MNQTVESSGLLKQYHVWDRSVRIFHWVNVLCVLGLVAVGTVILNSKALGVTPDGKVLLKTVHVYIGYIFVLNLSWRLAWAFLGNRFSRWQSIIPFTKEHRASFKVFLDGEKNNDHAFFLGQVCRLFPGLCLPVPMFTCRLLVM
jgi:Ni,Fe-hydrogenase I cytochrome b subunit